MMMHPSIPIDEDLQQTLSFFEKIAARHGGLGMLGLEDATFHCLIESFPRLLLCFILICTLYFIDFLEAEPSGSAVAGSILSSSLLTNPQKNNNPKTKTNREIQEERRGGLTTKTRFWKQCVIQFPNCIGFSDGSKTGRNRNKETFTSSEWRRPSFWSYF